MYINRVKNLYIKLGRSFRSKQKKKKKKKHVGSIEIPKDSNRQPSLANRSRDFNIRRYHLSNHLSLSLFLSKLPPSSSLSRVHHEWLYRWSAKRTREKEGREKNKRRSGRKRIRREDFALTRIKRRRFRNVTIFCIDRGDLSESMRKAYLTTFQRLLDSCRSPRIWNTSRPNTKSRRSRRRINLSLAFAKLLWQIVMGSSSDTHLTSVWTTKTNTLRLNYVSNVDDFYFSRSIWNNKKKVTKMGIIF